MDADFRVEPSRHAGVLKIMREGGVRGDTWVFSFEQSRRMDSHLPKRGKVLWGRNRAG